MKNEIQWMPIPKIKRLMKLRLMSLLLSVLFIVLTITFLLGKPVMHWSFAGSLLAAAACIMLAAASGTWCYSLNNKLSGSGL